MSLGIPRHLPDTFPESSRFEWCFLQLARQASPRCCSVVLYCWETTYACLLWLSEHDLAFRPLPWAKRYKEGNIKCICPEIDLSMPGTSHTGSSATGNVTCFWYQMVCGQGWHSVRNTEKPDKVTLHCHLLGLCWVPQSLVYIIWWWNKGATDQIWVSSSQRNFTT